MVSSDDLNSMFIVGIVAHAMAFLAFGYLSVGDETDPAKRRVSVWSSLSHVPLLVAYAFLKVDAGLFVQGPSVIFAQPIWVAWIIATVLVMINVNLVERVSKAYGIANVIFAGASTYLFFLSGRDGSKRVRDALYAVGWLALGFNLFTTMLASRLRRGRWVGYDGVGTTGLPFTPLERFLQHTASALTYTIVFVNALALGLSNAIGGRIPYANQYIAYLVTSLLLIAVQVMQYAGHREIGAPNKRD